jgi:hypothetical protein
MSYLSKLGGWKGVGSAGLTNVLGGGRNAWLTGGLLSGKKVPGQWDFASAIKPWQDAWANIAPGVIEDQQAEAEAKAAGRPYPFTGIAGPEYDQQQARQQWAAGQAAQLDSWRQGREPYYQQLQQQYMAAMNPQAAIARDDASRRSQMDTRRRGLAHGSRDYAARSNVMADYANALQNIERQGYQMAQRQRQQDLDTEQEYLRRVYGDMPGDVEGYQTQMDYLRALSGATTELGTLNADRARNEAAHDQDVSRIYGSMMSNAANVIREQGPDLWRGIRDARRDPWEGKATINFGRRHTEE